MLIRSGAERLFFRARDISIGGMQFSGASPLPVGHLIEVQLGRDVIEGEIHRQWRDGFAVRFAPTFNNKIAMTRRVFSGNYSRGVRDIRSGQVAQTILARLLR